MDTQLSLPNLPNEDGSRHSLHLFSVGLPDETDRDAFVYKASQEAGITFGVHYSAIPTFTAYKNLFPPNSSESLYPNALDWGKRTISLSLSAAVQDDDCMRIVDFLKSTILKY